MNVYFLCESLSLLLILTLKLGSGVAFSKSNQKNSSRGPTSHCQINFEVDEYDLVFFLYS